MASQSINDDATTVGENAKCLLPDEAPSAPSETQESSTECKSKTDKEIHQSSAGGDVVAEKSESTNEKEGVESTTTNAAEAAGDLEKHTSEIIQKALKIVQSDAAAKSKGSCSSQKSAGTAGTNSIPNGDSLDLEEYEDLELEEPFSESEDDEVGAPAARRPHLNLPLPRRRIRTLSGTLPKTGYSPVWGGPTMCLGCLEFFDLPKQTDQYVGHLLEKHRIVITDIELIVDLKRYVEHWRHRFGQQPIEEIFPKVIPKKGDSLHGKVEWYYLMSELKSEEDRNLREKLAMRRLEEVLYCQQREREDAGFVRQCLFCRYKAKGNRSKIIHHLYMIHHLNLGSPDNLVFVSEYLDLLKSKLDQNQCLYCEKVFTEHQLLMEHMRKRQHREVNPKNTYYDKFYVINYLELGKKWLDVLAEDFEDSTTTFVDSDEEEEDDSWHEWVQDNLEEETETMVVCLICDQSLEGAGQFIEHIKKEHNYDLMKLLSDKVFYERIKILNYIRKLSYNCICWICEKDDLHSWQALRKHLSDGDHINHRVPEKDKWNKDEYLLPVFENDNLLWVLESKLSKELDGGMMDEHDKRLEKVECGSGESAATSLKVEEVDQVIAEDLPELESILQDSELRDQLE